MNSKKLSKGTSSVPLKDRTIFRAPMTETNVAVISNDLLDFDFGNDTAKLLLLLVLRQPNDFMFTVNWAMNVTNHHKSTILSALACLEQNGFLTKIPVSRKQNRYYFYESWKFNPDFKGKAAVRESNPKTQNKGKTMGLVIRKSISLLNKAQLNLAHLNHEMDVAKFIDALQNEIEQLRVLEEEVDGLKN